MADNAVAEDGTAIGNSSASSSSLSLSEMMSERILAISVDSA